MKNRFDEKNQLRLSCNAIAFQFMKLYSAQTVKASETRSNSSSQPNLNFTEISENVKRSKRAATARPERVWDYAVIPYEIDANFSGVHKALFKQVPHDLS